VNVRPLVEAEQGAVTVSSRLAHVVPDRPAALGLAAVASAQLRHEAHQLPAAEHGHHPVEYQRLPYRLRAFLRGRVRGPEVGLRHVEDLGVT
jgi:hypothetical protein